MEVELRLVASCNLHLELVTDLHLGKVVALRMTLSFQKSSFGVQVFQYLVIELASTAPVGVAFVAVKAMLVVKLSFVPFSLIPCVLNLS